MTQLERLMRLTAEGDLAAAAELRREATRRDDPRALALSCAALGDMPALIEAASSAWDASDWPRLEHLSSALGVVITQEIAARIKTLLDSANRRIRRRRAQPSHVLLAIADVTSGALPFSAINSGQGTGGSRCAVVLAVRNADPTPEQTLTLGVASAEAAAGTPSSAWPTELRPWRPDTRETHTRLTTWSARTDAPDRIRLHILPSSDAFALLSHTSATSSVAAVRAWSDKLAKATRAPLTRAKWRQICTLIQDPPDHDTAQKALADFLHRRYLNTRSGDAAWLRDALSLGPAALPHWHLTSALVLDSPSTPPLTRTCTAMQGLQEISLNYTYVLSPADQAQSFAAIANSPYLTSLKTLHIQGSRLDLTSAQILWGDSTRLPHLHRLALREVRALPPHAHNAPHGQPWPLLRRPLDTLILNSLTINPPFIETALQWLHDSPHKPPTCWIEGHNLTPISTTLTRWYLPHIQSLTLGLHSTIPSIAAAILNKLDLPDLTYFTLHISTLTPEIIDALTTLRDRAPALIPGMQCPILTLHENNDTILQSVLDPNGFGPAYTRPWHTFRAQIRAKLLPRWRIFP